MKPKKIPVYVVCGEDAKERAAFFGAFCTAKNAYWQDFSVLEQGTEANRQSDAAKALSAALQTDPPDEVWLDWDDALPLEQLFALLQQPELKARLKLRKIVRCGDGLTEWKDHGANLRQQLTQCDLFAVPQRDRRELTGIRRRVRPLQPDIEVISRSEPQEIAAVLGGRNMLQGVRFLFILVLVGALMVTLARLRFSLPDSMAVFLGTYLQALPFLLLGILLSSAIQVFVPAGLLQRIFPKNLPGGMLFGVLGGFVLPICDCASIPVFRSLLRKGVPLPAAVTFMIAAPIINPVVMLSTYYAFGCNPRMMFTRMGFGVLCSVLVGLCFAFRKKSVLLGGEVEPACACGHCAGEKAEHGPLHEHEHEPKAGQGWESRVWELLSHFGEEFFEVARFLLIGIGVSTILQMAMGSKLTNLSFTNLAEAMLLMMAMAFLLSLCSSSDAVVGKNMGASLPTGAVMAFMVFGPMIDVKNVILMSASFTKRFMAELLVATFAVSFITVYVAFSLGLGALIA